MSKIKKSDHEHSVQVRPMRIEDFDSLIEMQGKCFPGMKTWKREQIQSQLEQFPEGQLVIEYDGRIAASSSSLVVHFGDYSEWHNWHAISDNGFIRNHDPEGDTLYGIEIMVHPDFRGLKFARRLYEARKQLCRDMGLARIVIAGRVSGYGKHADKMSAREYIERVARKELVDPVLTVQMSNDFVLRGLIPDYFPSDSESRGYATYLEWVNLEYVPTVKRQFRSVNMVRVSVVQYQMRTISSFEEFARQSEYFVDVASDYRGDFVLFPELFTNQLLSCVGPTRPGLAARELTKFTGQYLDHFSGLAVKYNVNVIGGSHFTLEGDLLYNISYLFRRDGSIGKQYKLHITPNERKWWGVSAGDKLEVFDTDCGKIAILICYDVEFPELARIVTDKGARMLFVPFNTDIRQGYLRIRTCAHARAVENQLYVATAGCVGNLPFVENVDIHYAQSGIYTPADFGFSRDGVAAESEASIETILIHDVEMEALRRHRRHGTVLTWNDRRRDLYRVAYKDGDVQREV